MKLEYDIDDDGPEDEAAYETAYAELLDRLEAWLRTAPAGERIPEPAGVAADAGIALSWKRWYAEGHLARWTVADVAEFLLDWCPRKVSTDADGAIRIAGSLVALISFLDAEGLLAPGSSGPAEVATFVVAQADALAAAMRDPSNFGPAKAFLGGGLGDLDDGADLDDQFDPFDPFEAFPGAADLDMTLPPVVMPSDDEIAAAKADAVGALTQLAALVAFLGAGRPLTAKGNLRLADARTLGNLLGTGDVVDGSVKAASSADLVGLHQLFQWGKEARFVRVAKGKAIATKKGLAIDRDRAAVFDQAFDALLELGPLGSQRNPSWWLAWPDVVDLLDEEVPGLLLSIYASPFPVPLTDLVDFATQLVLDEFVFESPKAGELVPRRITRDVRDILDVFARAGVLRWIALPDDPDPDPDDAIESDAAWIPPPTADDIAELDREITLRIVADGGDDAEASEGPSPATTSDPAADETGGAEGQLFSIGVTSLDEPAVEVDDGGADADPVRAVQVEARSFTAEGVDIRLVEPANLAVELTAAGIDAARRLAGSMGLDAPVAGRYADSSALELMQETDVEDFTTFFAESNVWRQRRSPDAAVAELAGALVELADPALQNLALAMMADIDAGLAEPHVLRIADEPGCAGFARCWLVDHGFAEPSTLYDPANPSSFVDILASRMVTGGPDALVDTLALVGDQPAQLAFLEAAWRAPSAAAMVVLVALGKVHPSKAIAKAARKASFKRQSAAIDTA